MVFLLEGELEVRGAKVHRLKSSDILLLNPPGLFATGPAVAVRINPLKSSFFVLLKIDPSFLSRAFDGRVPLFECDSSRQEKDFSVLRGILAEIAASGTEGLNTNVLFHARLYRLLYELSENFTLPRKMDELGGDSAEEADARRRHDILSYLRENFRSSISLDELAGALAISPQYLSRYFKKAFGINFHRYINQLRLENALKDLAFTKNPITTVAYDNGFPNLTAFTKELKDKTGQTPTAYRKAYRVEKSDPSGTETATTSGIQPALLRDKLAPYIIDRKGFTGEKRKLAVDASGGIPLEKPWREVINLGFASDFEKSDFIAHVKLIQNELPFRYARFQGLFARTMFFSDGSVEHGFARVDKVIDSLYSARLIPFIELGFKPAKINRNKGDFVFNNEEETPTLSNEEFEEIISLFLKHAINRYGLEEINQWRFEFWAPHNEVLVYDERDIDSYIEQFIRIRKTIKELVPAAQICGPGYNVGRPSNKGLLRKILERLDAAGALPDSISFYVFCHSDNAVMVDDVKKSGLWAKNEIPRRIAKLKKFAGDLGRQEHFFVTEWNMDASCRNPIHDSTLKAPFVLQANIDTIGSVGVFAYWIASDLSAEYKDSDAPLFGGAGLITRHGIRKPAFYAYQFLSKLGGRLLSKGDGYIVTARSIHEFTAIVFNYKYLESRFLAIDQYLNIKGDIAHYLEDLKPCLFSLEIRNIKTGRYKVKQHILNSRNGSVLDAWMGLSSHENLQASEIAWLEKFCTPGLRIDFIDCRGSLMLECDLEPNEVRLLEINLILT
jgi:beta-xylosidase/AraC-like DNA-binding protein